MACRPLEKIFFVSFYILFCIPIASYGWWPFSWLEDWLILPTMFACFNLRTRFEMAMPGSEAATHANGDMSGKDLKTSTLGTQLPYKNTSFAQQWFWNVTLSYLTRVKITGWNDWEAGRAELVRLSPKRPREKPVSVVVILLKTDSLWKKLLTWIATEGKGVLPHLYYKNMFREEREKQLLKT